MLNSRRRFLVALVLLFLIFLFDTFVTPNFTIWFLYVLPVLFLTENSGKTIYMISLAATVLMITGYFLSYSLPLPLYRRLANRGSGITVVWITAFLVRLSSNAMEKANANQKHLRKLINILPIGVVFLNLKNRIVLANHSAVSIFGKINSGSQFYPAEEYKFYSREGEELKPQDLSLIINVNGGELFHNTVLIKFENSVIKILTVDSVRVSDENGKLIGTINVFTDITEKTRIEQDRERLVAEWEAMINALPDGIIVYNKNTTIKFINDIAKNIFNFENEDLKKTLSERMRKYLIKNVNKNEHLAFEDLFSKAMKGEVVHSKIFKLDVGSQTYWLSLSSAQVKTEESFITGIVISFTDVTELIKLQKSLVESENRFRSMFECNRAIMLLVDPVSRYVIDANQSALQFYNYSLEEIKAKRIDEINVLSLEKLKTEMKEALVGKQYFKFKHRLSDGQVRWVEVYSSPIKFENRDVLFSIIHDITDRHKAENDIRRLNEELEIRAVELETVNKDMESFSYSVSHDLRNPLFIMENLHKYLTEDYGERLDDTGREYLKHIGDSIFRMKKLISDLLQLSRVGRHELVRHEINLSVIVSKCLMELKRVEPQRKVELIIQDNIYASVDPHLIQIGLENLIRNAWKFTSKRDDARIEFGREIKNGKEVFYIKDNGTGFDMKDERRIFEPFVRAHAEGEFKGTGVGLSIVDRVIQRHGGKIWAVSEVGKGASFYFTFT
ncbi:MAG TPA: PAS domain S-box protein [Mariniphaga sp.]|nr:PAS domain S-box protein [Mariniphaga sp.]